MKIKKVMLVFILIFTSSFIKAQQPLVEDMDFIHYIQSEINRCANNLQEVLSTNENSANIIVDECSRTVVNANRLGKIEYVYGNSEEQFKRRVESCSEFLRAKPFLECVYEND